VALAYYGYSYTSNLNDPKLDLMRELAEEKILTIESKVAGDDDALLRSVRLDELDKLDEQMRTVGGAVSSVFVLDDRLKPVPGGSSAIGDPKEAVQSRDWYLANVIPKLALQKQRLNVRGHYYDRRGERPFLLAFMRKQQGDRTYYVVIEDGVNHLVGWLFPQVFDLSNVKKRLYQVVDERGQFAYGVPFTSGGALVQEVKFIETLDDWAVRVTQIADPAAEQDLNRTRIVDSLLIGGAVTVILAGLGFLAIAIRRERRANELKSDFISNVSHELKTPLSIITMFGEMLANGRTKSPEQATEYAEIIFRESVRLDRLIENVLDFAKIERGMGVYEFAEADIGEVVTRAVDLAARRLATAQMTIDVELEPDLPLVKIDANAFTLAVLNMIDNAIKYAADGKRVALTLKRDGDRVVLAVRDWGPGIAAEEHARIFERFYRAKAMRLKPIRGSGIGLALVQHIARAHGGDVTVTSTPGEGSTFQLWLPI
jgi:two-component system, OmpR family, phosphate regulon sensor histidine kinase PhoR